MFGGSCESDGLSQLLIPLLFRFASTIDTMHSMTKILQGKTVYLAKITDKLVTKVNNLQSFLCNIVTVFLAWQGKLTQFADHKNCNFNNSMEFLSKFSLEVTRALPRSQRFFLIFLCERDEEQATKRRQRVAKAMRRERKTSGYLGLESHFHADDSCQMRQIANKKIDQWPFSKHVLVSCYFFKQG